MQGHEHHGHIRKCVPVVPVFLLSIKNSACASL
jgi:hypothetical protein